MQIAFVISLYSKIFRCSLLHTPLHTRSNVLYLTKEEWKPFLNLGQRRDRSKKSYAELDRQKEFCKRLTSFVRLQSRCVIMHVEHVSIYSFRCWVQIKNGDRNETRLAEENGEVAAFRDIFSQQRRYKQTNKSNDGERERV